jgi:hypothetical protein
MLFWSTTDRKEVEKRSAPPMSSPDLGHDADGCDPPLYAETNEDDTGAAVKDSVFPKTWLVNMVLIPYGRSRMEGNSLHASLRVVTRDLSTLMREGFYWDAANATACKFRWEYVEPNGWYWTRVITLRDLDHLDFPLWKAILVIYGRQGVVDPEVASFRINDLSVSDVDSVTAEPSAGQEESNEEVYLYDRRYPEINLNKILPGRTMEGWWPWPRASLTVRPRARILTTSSSSK